MRLDHKAKQPSDLASMGPGIATAEVPRYNVANDPASPGVDRQRHGWEGASEWIRVGAWVRRHMPTLDHDAAWNRPPNEGDGARRVRFRRGTRSAPSLKTI
jgi:hypothetical protein